MGAGIKAVVDQAGPSVLSRLRESLFLPQIPLFFNCLKKTIFDRKPVSTKTLRIWLYLEVPRT